MDKETLEELDNIYVILLQVQEYLDKIIEEQINKYESLTLEEKGSQSGEELGNEIYTLQDALNQLSLANEILSEFD